MRKVSHSKCVSANNGQLKVKQRVVVCACVHSVITYNVSVSIDAERKSTQLTRQSMSEHLRNMLFSLAEETKETGQETFTLAKKGEYQ